MLDLLHAFMIFLVIVAVCIRVDACVEADIRGARAIFIRDLFTNDLIRRSAMIALPVGSRRPTAHV